MQIDKKYEKVFELGRQMSNFMFNHKNDDISERTKLIMEEYCKQWDEAVKELDDKK